jgi:hypothetical protein
MQDVAGAQAGGGAAGGAGQQGQVAAGDAAGGAGGGLLAQQLLGAAVPEDAGLPAAAAPAAAAAAPAAAARAAPAAAAPWPVCPAEPELTAAAAEAGALLGWRPSGRRQAMLLAVRLAVPRLAQSCIVKLLDSEDRNEEFNAARGGCNIDVELCAFRGQDLAEVPYGLRVQGLGG